MSPNLMEPGPGQRPPEMEPAEALRVLLWSVVALLVWIELILALAEWLS